MMRKIEKLFLIPELYEIIKDIFKRKYCINAHNEIKIFFFNS